MRCGGCARDEDGRCNVHKGLNAPCGARQTMQCMYDIAGVDSGAEVLHSWSESRLLCGQGCGTRYHSAPHCAPGAGDHLQPFA